LFGGQFKGNCRNCGAIGYEAQDCKIRLDQIIKATEILKISLNAFIFVGQRILGGIYLN
jgi:hypothetical protein